MKYAYGLALAAALVFGCSSSSKNTRTSSNEAGAAQAGTVAGTSSTAGTQADQGSMSNQPSSSSSTASNQGTTGTGSTAAQPGDTGTSGSTYGQSGTTGSSGSTYGQSGTTESSGSTYGQGGMGTAGAGSATSSADPGNLRTVTGAVQRVDQNSITLDQGVTLMVDSQTQVLRKGQPVAAGIAAIHEGNQVRASFDPASNRAEKIEVMSSKKAKKSGSAGDQTQPMPDTGSDSTNPNPR